MERSASVLLRGVPDAAPGPEEDRLAGGAQRRARQGRVQGEELLEHLREGVQLDHVRAVGR